MAAFLVFLNKASLNKDTPMPLYENFHIK